MNKSSTLGSVFESAKKLFFKNIEGELMLGDSYGTVTHVSEPAMWSLGTFCETNGLEPSRYKLYVINYVPSKSELNSIKFQLNSIFFTLSCI